MDEHNVNDISVVLRELREERKLRQEDLAEILNVKRQTYSAWERGISNPDIDAVKFLSEFYGVATDYILGRTSIRDPEKYYSNITKIDSDSFVKIPVIGVIRAGDPIYAEENIIGYEYADKKDLIGDEYFYLKVKGDSMNKSRIEDGDLVLVRAQNDVNDGDIAVVVVNGCEATLKRVFRNNGTLILQPDSTNPIHKPQIYNTKNSLDSDIKILGKVINAKIKF